MHFGNFTRYSTQHLKAGRSWLNLVFPHLIPLPPTFDQRPVQPSVSCCPYQMTSKHSTLCNSGNKSDSSAVCFAAACAAILTVVRIPRISNNQRRQTAANKKIGTASAASTVILPLFPRHNGPSFFCFLFADRQMRIAPGIPLSYQIFY